MSLSELKQEIAIEWESIQIALDELVALETDVGEREPMVREVAAAGLFLANLYNGIENVLKRLCRYHSIDISPGPDWHVELVKALTDPPREGLPVLFDQQLASELGPYRRFRHVVHHGYGFQLRWEDMLPGIEGATDVVSTFKKAVESHLNELTPSNQ